MGKVEMGRRIGARRAVLAVVAFVAASLSSSAWIVSAHASPLLDGRAWEQVTPGDTGSMGVATADALPIAVAINDDEVLWGGGINGLGADQQSGAAPYFLAQRTATGWVSTSLWPTSYSPYEDFAPLDATDDLSAIVFQTQTPQVLSVPADAQNTPTELVYRDADGGFSTIVDDGLNDVNDTTNVADDSLVGGMSADGQTVYYSSEVTPASLPAATGEREVYEWHPAGYDGNAGQTVSMVGAGTALEQCGLEIGGLFDQTVLTGSPSVGDTNAVSSDGQTVFLQSGDSESPLPSGCPSASQLYVDHDGTLTEISVPTGGTAAPTTLARALFQGASPDGDIAYFTSTEALTSNAPAGDEELYEWTAAQGSTAAAVTCLTCALPYQSASLFAAPIAVSENGQYVYFTTDDPSNPLYVSHAGVTSEVASNPASPPIIEGISEPGNEVVFSDVPALAVGNSSGTLYRSVITGTTPGAPQCLSCESDGTVGDGQLGLSSVEGVDPFAQTPSARGMSTLIGGDGVGISADGNTIVFTSDDALGVAGSQSQSDVYEWTAGTGPELITETDSTGKGAAAISPDGQDIFAFSDAALTGDTAQPDTYALYDARVGGGFPAATPPATCTGSGCQAPPDVVSAPGAPASATVTASPGTSPSAARALSASISKDGNRVRLVTWVWSNGPLQLTATATVGRRRLTALSLSRESVGLPGQARMVVLEAGLSSHAAALLRTTGRLRLLVTVRFRGHVASHATVTFTHAVKKRNGRRLHRTVRHATQGRRRHIIKEENR